jgi:hypothetical protein
MTDQQLATTEQKPRPSMTVGGNVGALIPQDIEQAFRIASALAQSGMTPNGFKTPETCFVAIMAGAELGLPPFQSLQSFAIINGRPTLFGAALMAVIRTNGFKVREWFEGEGDELTAFCELTRPDNGDVAEASFSVADAKTAKLWGKAGPWVTNWKRMLQWRARGFCFTDGAADVLKGLQIREAVEGDEPLPVETPAKSGTGLLAKLQTNETLATEGFGIRDIKEEAGEASPAPEPAPKKRGRPAKSKVEELSQQVSEDIQTLEKGVSAMEAAEDADPSHPSMTGGHGAADEDTIDTAKFVHEGPAPADTVYFMVEDEVYPSGRRAVYLNGLPNGVVEATDDHPIHAQHAPVKAKDKSADSAPAENPQEVAEIPTTTEGEADKEADKTTSSTTPVSAFDIFDAAARSAVDWPELSRALTELARAPEWKTDAESKRAARLKAWGRVARWNEEGAKLDPATSPNLLQIYVTASEDPEAIQALYALAQGAPWLAEADETMQSSVSRFVMDRLAEIRGA